MRILVVLCLLGAVLVGLFLGLTRFRQSSQEVEAPDLQGPSGPRPTPMAPTALERGEPVAPSTPAPERESMAAAPTPDPGAALDGFVHLSIGFSDDYEGAPETEVHVTCETGAQEGTQWSGSYRMHQPASHVRLPVGRYRVELPLTGGGRRIEIRRPGEIVPVRFDVPRLAQLELQLIQKEDDEAPLGDVECSLYSRGRELKRLEHDRATDRWVAEVLPRDYEIRCKTRNGPYFAPVDFRAFPGPNRRVVWLEAASFEPPKAASRPIPVAPISEYRQLEFVGAPR